MSRVPREPPPLAPRSAVRGDAGRTADDLANGAGGKSGGGEQRTRVGTQGCEARVGSVPVVTGGLGGGVGIAGRGCGIPRYSEALPGVELALALRTAPFAEGLRLLENGESDLHCGGADPGKPASRMFAFTTSAIRMRATR